MRIIAGQFRRRLLKTNPGSVTRPWTDRAKEILFENLGGELNGEHVADIFAGTGNMGLEALSRGASSAVFIEKDIKAFELLQSNVALLGVEDRTLCWKTDVLRCSFKPFGVPQFCPWDLIFFDPPYPMAKELQPGRPLNKALDRLARPDVSSESALLVLRTEKHDPHHCPPAWQLRFDLQVSNMLIGIYSKSGEPEEIAENQATVEAVLPEDQEPESLSS